MEKKGKKVFELINALGAAAKRLVKNPALLLPAFAAIAIFFALAYAFSPFMEKLALDLMILGNVPDAPLSALPFQLIGLYGLEFSVLLVFFVLSSILFAALNYWYAAYAASGLGSKESLGKASHETIKAMGKIASFTVFILLLVFLFVVLLWISLAIMPFFEIGSLVLLALLALAGFYFAIKFVFVLQALAIEHGSVRQALEKAWLFCEGRFWQVLAFVIVLSVVYGILLWAGGLASGLFSGEVESLIVFAAFWGIFLAYSGLALAFYYKEKK
ncbi:MAG: hypothetical protein WC634_03470 [archaeon]